MNKAIIIVVLALAAVASAQWSCVDTKNPEAAPVCNTTALQAMLPAKACANGAVTAFTNDWTYSCVSASYDAWKNSCPKKNLNQEGFCGGTGSLEGYHCFLLECETDADCPSNDPQPPVTPQTPCYDCCQQCHEDAFCDTNSGTGKTYAAKDSTDCVSCAVVEPTSTNAPGTTPTSSAATITGFGFALAGVALL